MSYGEWEYVEKDNDDDDDAIVDPIRIHIRVCGFVFIYFC